MKKKLLVIFSLFLGGALLSGCQKIQLHVKHEQFRVELGNPIQKEAVYYIDMDDLDEKQQKDVYTNAKLSIHTTDDDLMHKYDLSYEKEGTYQASIMYKGQEVDFEIVVEDTRAPVILGNSEADLEIFDYNDVEEVKIEGNLVSVSDQAGHTSQKLIHQIIKEQVKLAVPYYNQMEVNAPNGCETTSLYMALKYKDCIDIDLVPFIQNEPYAASPYNGFAGNPFERAQKQDDYYAIFPTPLALYGSQYTPCQDISGSTLTDIKSYLSQECPVLVWMSGRFQDPVKKTFYFGEVTKNLHIVLLTGYDDEKKVFYVNDPAVKDLTEVDYEQFEKVYDSMRFAMVVE